ncbi:MAG: hypothetical protein ABSH53_06035 [Holophaga sp.]
MRREWFKSGWLAPFLDDASVSLKAFLQGYGLALSTVDPVHLPQAFKLVFRGETPDDGAAPRACLPVPFFRLPDSAHSPDAREAPGGAVALGDLLYEDESAQESGRVQVEDTDVEQVLADVEFDEWWKGDTDQVGSRSPWAGLFPVCPNFDNPVRPHGIGFYAWFRRRFGSSPAPVSQEVEIPAHSRQVTLKYRARIEAGAQQPEQDTFRVQVYGEGGYLMAQGPELTGENAWPDWVEYTWTVPILADQERVRRVRVDLAPALVHDGASFRIEDEPAGEVAVETKGRVLPRISQGGTRKVTAGAPKTGTTGKPRPGGTPKPAPAGTVMKPTSSAHRPPTAGSVKKPKPSTKPRPAAPGQAVPKTLKPDG